MKLYKITALQPISIHVRQFNSNILCLHPDEMPRTDKEAFDMFRAPEVIESTFELLSHDSPIGDVLDFISLTSKDGLAAGKVFQWSDFRLPLEVGDRASDEGVILIERTL